MLTRRPAIGASASIRYNDYAPDSPCHHTAGTPQLLPRMHPDLQQVTTAADLIHLHTSQVRGDSQSNPPDRTTSDPDTRGCLMIGNTRSRHHGVCARTDDLPSRGHQASWG
jgi:hypothetical protein